MAKQQAPQQNQPQPGAFFRQPGVGARPRMVPEVGPGQQGQSTTLQQATSVTANFSKFSTLDIVRSYFLEVDYATTYTTSTGASLSQSPLAPANGVQLLQVQFESAYNTYRLPGWLALIMQSYRPMFAPKQTFSSWNVAGANVIPNNSINASGNWFPSTSPTKVTPNLALNTTGTLQNYSMLYEVPVSCYFDLYYELSATGQPLGYPIPRAIVSPQRMASSTRNVIPTLTFAPGIATNNLLTSPVSTTSVTTQTFTGTAATSWWRDGWIPTDNMLTEPPTRLWQYSRDYIQNQPNQAGQPIIPLDDEVIGQGQIMSLVFATWDPALNSGAGGFTPYSAYQSVELLLGSDVQLYKDSPVSNTKRWADTHGAILPNGCMGWDLALTEDGRLTNENVINTLVQNGAQLRITWNSGSIPSSGATTYIGMESLKKVGQ